MEPLVLPGTLRQESAPIAHRPPAPRARGVEVPLRRRLRRAIVHRALRLLMACFHRALRPAECIGRALRRCSLAHSSAGWHGKIRHAGPASGRTPEAFARARAGDDVLLTGTFYSGNWIAAHVRPLAAADACRRVLVVSTFPVPAFPKVVPIYPPCWLQRAIGAVPARLLTFVAVALWHRPNVVGGFHLLVNGLLAALAARMIGARALYFCVGGPRELLDGGVWGENRVFGKLDTPDAVIEQQLIRAVAAFDYVITMGSSAVEFFRRRSVRTHFEVIAGGIDVTRFAPGAAAPTTDLILVGRLARVKRIDRFLEAVRIVADSYPAVKATIVGDGELRAALEAQARDLGLVDAVRFVGQQADVERWLRRSKIFVLTSESEGLALSLMEAMSCGLPAIVSDVGELGELVQHGLNGYLVASAKPRDFAHCMLDLLGNEQRRRLFGRAAYHSALRHHTSVISERWTDILNNGC